MLHQHLYPSTLLPSTLLLVHILLVGVFGWGFDASLAQPLWHAHGGKYVS